MIKLNDVPPDLVLVAAARPRFRLESSKSSAMGAKPISDNRTGALAG